MTSGLSPLHFRFLPSLSFASAVLLASSASAESSAFCLSGKDYVQVNAIADQQRCVRRIDKFEICSHDRGAYLRIVDKDTNTRDAVDLEVVRVVYDTTNVELTEIFHVRGSRGFAMKLGVDGRVETFPVVAPKCDASEMVPAATVLDAGNGAFKPWRDISRRLQR